MYKFTKFYFYLMVHYNKCLFALMFQWLPGGVCGEGGEGAIRRSRGKRITQRRGAIKHHK